MDPIAAIFGATTDAFIVFALSVLAILGLRSMYVLLAGVVHRIVSALGSQEYARHRWNVHEDSLYNEGMRLRTLGGLRLDGTDFTRPKPLLLLAYLTVEGAQSRRVLAELFFGHTKDPRDSLSTAIRHFKDFEADLVTMDVHRLEACVECDTSDLLESLDAGLFEPMAEMYRGPFLSGLDLDLGEELEEWVFTTREYLGAQVRDAHVRFAERLRARNETDKALQFAEEALALTEAPPPTTEMLGRLHALLAGSNSPRIQILERMAQEVGIRLPEGTAVQLPGSAPAVEPPHSIPGEHTSFVGRQEERLALAKYLADADIRLVTVHGPGGIGKTRLAKRAARDQLQTAHFPDGIYVVELEAVPSIERTPEAIASVLGLESSEQSTPMEQVRSALSDARLLLVLDGFEHLTKDAHWISQLIDATSHAKILVTSRTRLNLAEEHVLALSGLPSPHFGEDTVTALTSDALQLLVQRAKKSMLDFVLTDADLPDAVSLCRLLEGSPLAIELAMSWIRAMPLSEIRQRVETGPELLDASTEHRLEKHRGLRVVFERSYGLLRPKEQESLAKLSVFRGGFKREAAAKVAGATLSILVQLIDASLVRAGANGRYSLHTLIQQFASERLSRNGDAFSTAQAAHAEYFRSYTADLLAQMYTDAERSALDSLNADLPNILKAWDRILENEWNSAAEFPMQLVVFFDRLGLFWEGLRFFERCSLALGRHGMDEGDLMSEVLANRAWLHYRIGDMAESEALAKRATSTGSVTSRGRMMASNITGAVLQNVGRDAEAIEHLEDAVRIATTLGQPNRAAMYLINLATAKKATLDHEGAELDFMAAIRVAKRENYPFLIVMAKNNLAVLMGDAGNFDDAGHLFREALQVVEETNYTTMKPILLANLADNFVDQNEIPQAEATFQTAMSATPGPPSHALRALFLDIQGRIALRKGHVAEAERLLLESLEHALEHPQDKRYLKVLVHLSETWITKSRWSLALRALEFAEPRVRHLPALRKHVHHLLGSIPQDARDEAEERDDSDWRPEMVLDRTHPTPSAKDRGAT